MEIVPVFAPVMKARRAALMVGPPICRREMPLLPGPKR
jgi:hypothetical protein